MDNVRPFPRDMADNDDHAQTEPEYLDAERAVLGGCMHYPKNIPDVAAVITGGDFQQPAHETIWAALLHLYEQGAPTDPISLRFALEKSGDLQRVGGHAYLHTIAEWALPNPDYYAEQVAARAELRAEADLGRRIVQRATAPEAQPGAAVTFIDDYLQRQKERAAGRSGDRVDALIAEMLSTDALDDMPTLEPLVGDLLHLDSLARIIGPSGHMKSFMTIDFAAHVGTGTPWHGHHVRQGTVIYLVAEGARGIRKRVRAWEQYYGMRMDNVLFLPRPVQAMSPEWDTLIAACTRVGPALIVIDTQARVSVGVEENSAKELGLVIDRMEQLRAATAACVLVIHHTGHVGEHGRGSSSAKGALQSELHVSKKGDNAHNTIVTMKTGKQKDDEEGGDVQFALKVVPIAGEAKPDGRPVTSVVLVSMDQVDPVRVEGTAEHLAARLDRAGIPVEYGVPRVRELLPQLGIQASKSKVEEAVKIRKAKRTNRFPENLPVQDSTNLPAQNQGAPGSYAEPAGQTSPHPTGEVPGNATPAPPSPLPVPRNGEGGETAPEPTGNEPPKCTVCHTPMDREWHHRGYDTHVGCDPRTGSHPPTTEQA